MPKLPETPTIEAIWKYYAEKESAEKPRTYLGGSQIGAECSRALWYGFRNVGKESFNPRILKLFETGHITESRLIENLRAAGVEVLDIDPSTREQWRFKSCGGHFSIGLDGVVHGLKESSKWHVLETKSMNKKHFDDLEKNGVEKSHHQHFIQCQVGMGLAELERALYLVSCKDDDRLWFERLTFNPTVFKASMLKAERIINAESAPDRLSEDPSFFKCKFCPFAGNCHGEKMPQVNCRTCVHSSPVEDAKWSCAMGREMGPCEGHLFIPSLLHWAEPLDGDPTFIRYKIKSTGREFVNVSDVGFPSIDLPHYGSKELSECQVAAIGHPAVEAARTILGGEVVRG